MSTIYERRILMTGRIRITRSDIAKLETLLKARRHGFGRDRGHLESLKAELERAEIVEDAEIPADVITMHSRVLVQDVLTGQNSIYILVFPNEADLSLNKVSVLVPIGTALLGYQAGDIIEWNMPGGIRRFFVKDVLYQPEASGETASRARAEGLRSSIRTAVRAAS
jgi:regulator of nucleoside diphosphate kinase